MAACPLSTDQPIFEVSPRARILLVDSDEALGKFVRQVLSHTKYRLSEAQSGSEALLLFLRQRFDLVISDLGTPGFSGLQLLHALKDIDRRVPVVLMSRYGELEQVQEALKSGAENFLLKPLNAQVLITVIRKTLNLCNMLPHVGLDYPETLKVSYLEVPSHVDLVPQVVRQISQAAVTATFTHYDLDTGLKVALVEGITNAMEHGNRWAQHKKVSLQMEITRQRLQVAIHDEGEGFDLQALPNPTEEPHLLCERGRGVFLMRSIMDEVTFVPPGNQVIMRKIKKSG